MVFLLACSVVAISDYSKNDWVYIWLSLILTIWIYFKDFSIWALELTVKKNGIDRVNLMQLLRMLNSLTCQWYYDYFGQNWYQWHW